MKPQPTAVAAPIHLRIADDLRMRIERGELEPGDPLPTLQILCDDYDCSLNSARAAIALLKQQGLITGGRGKAATVRTPVPRVCRSSERHQAEKDLALQPQDVRASTGVAETDMGSRIEELSFLTQYDKIAPSRKLAADLGVAVDTEVLQRLYEMRDRRDGRRLSWSISYIPIPLIEGNPKLLDAANEPWPGGTLHQLHTVGIEVMKVVDQVSASMPTTAEAHEWRLDDGVPMLHVRRISYDEGERVVEISDANFPADRTELSFTTHLKKW
ncbi:GntR family transcriptional regulator [Couchioplanes caeruleus]|uniref:GntR family transcriptional regulator n=1 Tax=Couchioplanes caeruleus TaxID=56438 RepID=UPI0020C07DC5|nr:GntR family transcriptional regulator [Couchioplanes caeruleus]UQU67541.1 GntR family transcriptional regulator [Couchioplanes caeruleus]